MCTAYLMRIEYVDGNFGDNNYEFIIQIELCQNYLLIFNENKYNIDIHIKLYLGPRGNDIYFYIITSLFNIRT